MNENLLNSPQLIVAVDPGKSGAVCRMGQGKFNVWRDFKTLEDIARAIAEASSEATHGVIELVHAFPHQGVSSMFSFGRAAGVMDAALFLSLPKGVEVVEIAPVVWQRWFRDLLSWPQDKEFDSREIASKTCPWSTPFLQRKLDHGTGDAILLATWFLMQPENFDTQSHRSKFSQPRHKQKRQSSRSRKTRDSSSPLTPLA